MKLRDDKRRIEKRIEKENQLAKERKEKTK
jgi:hypothetical protein